MIEIQNLYKSIGALTILKGISLNIDRGEIVGFLGPNGAGKTTLMRIITTYWPPTSGRVKVGGLDSNRDALKIRRLIGYLPETPPLYPDMTVRDYLKFAAELKCVPRRQIVPQVDRALEECDLKEMAPRAIGVLSRGFRQRVGIAQAIIHDPEILILDEPTEGLDPHQILKVRQLIQKFEGQRTVILSTHILSEVELIAKRVVLIQAGEIVVDASLQNLLEREPLRTIYVRTQGQRETLEAVLKSIPGMGPFDIQNKDGNNLLAQIRLSKDQEGIKARLITALNHEGLPLLELWDKRPSLEEIFLSKTRECLP